MRRSIGIIIVLSIIGLGTVFAQELHPIMQPDPATLAQWVYDYETAELAYIDPDIHPGIGSFDLLSYIPYNATERNQASCGNCWQWACTGCVEIRHNVQDGVNDRLSIQYLNSCANSVIGKACCDGGNTTNFRDFYSSTGQFVPWSNSSAHWQDGDKSCDTSCGSIATSPNYSISHISKQSVQTHGVGKETAINNIKNVLHQNRGMYFSFYLATASDWTNFRSHWNNYDEGYYWNPNFSCGHTYETNQGGGHAVLCVGYNDNDPSNRYWIMLNSWGTVSGKRPHGVFLLDMDMDYDCSYYYPPNSSWYYSFNFETIDVTFSGGSSASADVDIYMPSTNFQPGDLCYCKVDVTNQGSSSMNGYPLFAILDVFGNYYCAPGWNSYSYYTNNYPPGKSTVDVMPSFSWPSGCGSSSGLKWYAAVTNPQISQVVSNVDTFTFGWSDPGGSPSATPNTWGAVPNRKGLRNPGTSVKVLLKELTSMAKRILIPTATPAPFGAVVP
jgi:Papain family cysteine protease